ncbi:retinaldehyde-binding protein 1-like [Ciona intestinalis]
MTSRYECTLSPELLEKAVRELNEPRDNDVRLRAIDALKKDFNSEKYGPLLRDDDSFLLRFLRARKYKHAKALRVLHKYHSMRKKFPEVFDKVYHPETMREVMECGIVYAANGTMKDGQSVIIYRPEKETAHMSFYDILACGQLAMDKLLDSEEYQICGGVTIDDFEHYDHESMKEVPASKYKKMTDLLQEATPVRIGPFHILNEGTKFDFMYSMMKPFMKRKLTKHITLHGKSIDKIVPEHDLHLLPPVMGTGLKLKRRPNCGWNL